MSAEAAVKIWRWSELEPTDRERLAKSAVYRASMLHPLCSDLAQQYFRAYFGYACSDLSLIALQNDYVVGYVLANALNGEVSYYGMPIMIFGEVVPFLVNSLKEIASLAGCRTIKLDQRDARALGISSYPVERTESAMVNLEIDARAIKAGLRQSYKSLVNWGLKNLEIRLLNAQQADRRAFMKMRDFHRQVAGRSTRSDETWEIQFEMIARGEAYTVLANKNGHLVSASFVQYSSVHAYYSVGVYDRDLMARRLPLAHGPLFYAIQYARDMGLKRFELGAVGVTCDTKQKNIGHFKRGFASAVEPGGWLHLDVN